MEFFYLIYKSFWSQSSVFGIQGRVFVDCLEPGTNCLESETDRLGSEADWLESGTEEY